MGSRQDERGDEIGGGGGAAAEPAPFCILPPREEMVNFMAHQQQQHNQNFLLHQQQHGQPPGPIMWQAPPPHIAAPPFPHLQPQQPQQHMYNECYYNLAFPGQTGQPESYSVLPVGPGNFLKVYHCPENAVNEANAPLFTHINMASLNHQHQHPHQQQHHQIPPQTPPQPTPLYELFSANPLLPKPDVNIAGASQSVSTALPQQQPQSPPPPQVLQTPNNANLLINNLVNNWSPNLTGGSYIQLGDDAKENATNQAEPHPPQALQPSQQPLAPVQPQSEPKSQTVNPLTANTKPSKSSSLPLATASVPPTAINKAPIVVSVQPEGKKRIVAEVKPMPMSYSDVLSKGTKTSTAARDLRAANGLDGSTQSQRRQGKDEGAGSREMRAAKRSPMHDAKEVAPGSSGGGHSHGSRSKKRGQSNQNQNASQKQQQQGQPQPQQQQQLQQPVQQLPNKTSKASNQEKKRPLQHKNNISSGNGNSNNLRVVDQKTPSTTIPVNSSSINSNGSNSTSATSASNLSRKQGNSKSNSNSNSNSSGPNYNTGMNSNHSNNNNVSSSSSKRYSSSNVNVNSNSSSGYSYSSKRNRNAYSSSNSPTHAGSFASNRNYELAKRILHTWWIYTLKLLTWLFYLVYDIVVLGFSMGYERLTLAYVAGLCYARQLHKELKQNSGKPTIWWRTYWRRFDARFAKNSKWAVWRRFYKRKPPEPSTESFKTGRLPQTGEEAMYSLLNCKGKDAYR